MDIQAPDLETRIAILKKEMHEHPETGVGEEIVELLAQSVTTNIRELKGALTQVVAMCPLDPEGINREKIDKMLADLFEPG